jgi:hypothetical protein
LGCHAARALQNIGAVHVDLLLRWNAGCVSRQWHERHWTLRIGVRRAVLSDSLRRHTGRGGGG